MSPRPHSTDSPDLEPQELTPNLVLAPGRDEDMSDTVTAPAGQTVIADGDRGCNRGYGHDHASLLTLTGQHRDAIHTATEGRFNALADFGHQKALADMEARNTDRFASVLNAIKEENGRTRELIQSQKVDDLRFCNLKLELAP
jgi:hypothetical protein